MTASDLRPAPPAAIVLAAGAGTRFGANKLLAPLHGKPLIRHAVEAVLETGIRPVIVVVAPDSGVEAALDGLDVHMASNPEAESGIASSIRAGVRSLPTGTAAALLALGDQPGITASEIRRLIDQHAVSGLPVTVSQYDGITAPPVIFDRSVFAELLELQGDRGAKEIMERLPRRVGRVAMTVRFSDVDTRADLARLGEEDR